jgi:membrane protein DedA with SNARE-associated domain
MTSYFAGIVDFIGGHPHYALTAIFLLALSEAIPVIGTIVPGSTLIIGICALATSAHLDPWLLLGVAIVGAIFGDGLSFWLGRRYHREIPCAGRLIGIRSSLTAAKHLSRHTEARASSWLVS